MKNKTYKRFADCIPVRGYFRSIIMDLTRKTYMFIPNMLCDGISNSELIDNHLPPEYIDFLVENEIVYECDKSELAFYPPLNMEWDYPATITNAVIEIGENQFFTKEYFEQIVDLGCRHFAFIFTEAVQISWIENISQLFDESPVLTVDIYCRYSENINDEELKNIMKQNTRITYILLYGSPNDEVITLSNIRGNIVYYSKPVFYDECNINTQLLTVNMPLYTEALHYNTFYNRKLCIDKNGNIKNYFTQKDNFGNIFSDKIEAVVLKKAFQEIWEAKKDNTLICKECEFRYMCTDHRLPIKGKKEYCCMEECNYNPYTCKWKNEEGYVPLKACGTYSNETGFEPDKEKIEELNKQIWGEDNE